MPRPRMLLGTIAIVLLPVALLGQPTLKITSPASDLVVHPGQTVDVHVSVSGPYSRVVLSGPSPVLTGETQSLDSPPYVFHATLPEGSVPGRYLITVSLHTNRTFALVASDEVSIDVERPDPPRSIRIVSGTANLPVGSVDDLYVTGIFDDGDEVPLKLSTRTKYEVQPPGVVSVSKEGAVTALAPGTARIIAHYDKAKAGLDVVVTNDGLKITSPAEGTVVHPGDKIAVNLLASGGPFRSVGIIVPGYINGSQMLSSPLYEFSFTMPAPSPEMRPGRSTIGAMGFTASGFVIAQISIDIEREDSPQKITLGSYELDLQKAWQLPIGVSGYYADGSITDLSQSMDTKYEPADPGVVSVTRDGVVTGLAPGSTAIVVRHRDKQALVKVVVTDDPR